MKARYIIIGAIAALLASACAREPFGAEPEVGGKNSLSVTMVRESRPETRALLLDTPGLRMESRWEAGDKMGVYGANSGKNVEYEVAAENIEYGGRTASFVTSGAVPQGKLTAYYPYQEDASVSSDGGLHLNFSDKQPFTRTKNVPAPYGPSFVMAGKGSKGEGVEMRNVMSLLKLGYIAPENRTITQVVLRDLSGAALNGKLDITWNDDIPVGTVSGGTSTITTDCGEGVLATGEDLTVFWFIVPARNYPKGISVTFTFKDGKTEEKTFGTTYGKTFERNTVYPIGDVYAPQTYGSDQVQWSYKDPDRVMIVNGEKTDLIKSVNQYGYSWPSNYNEGEKAWLQTLNVTAHKDFGGKVGDYVFFNEPSEALPDGFIGQIMEINSYGQEETVIIKAVEDISEPFRKLKLGSPIYGADGSFNENGGLELDLASNLERVETPDGIDLPFDVEGDTLTLYEPPTKAVTVSSFTSPRLKLKTIKENSDSPGEMTAGVQLKLTTKFSMGSDDDGNTEFLHFNINPKVLLTFNVKFSGSHDFEGLNGYMEFGTFHFAPITVGPLVLRPAVEIGAYCSASASVEFNVKYKYVANWGHYGFSYFRGQGFAVRSFMGQPDEEDGFSIPEFGLSGSIGMSVGLQATPELSLYGLITAKLASKFGLNFSAGYEWGKDSDGFSRGLSLSLTPEFGLTPSITTLGGIWTQKWEEWQPLEFDPIWQKYIVPEMKVTRLSAIAERADTNTALRFGNTTYVFKKITGYSGISYDFTLRKETLFGMGVGVAIYSGTKFNYTFETPDEKGWRNAGLEDYTNFNDAAMLNGKYEGAILIDTYDGPDDGEDVKRFSGTLDYKFENGVYYDLYPCVFSTTHPNSEIFLRTYPGVEHLVCHWPYLSNGELWPWDHEVRYGSGL